MRSFLAGVMAALLLVGCGQKCYVGRLELVYADKTSADKNKRPLSDYKVLIDQQTVPVVVSPDGTFQVCDLKAKRPTKIQVVLDGKKLPSAQTYSEKGSSGDPWIILAPGPLEGSGGTIDTSWVHPQNTPGPTPKP